MIDTAALSFFWEPLGRAVEQTLTLTPISETPCRMRFAIPSVGSSQDLFGQNGAEPSTYATIAVPI